MVDQPQEPIFLHEAHRAFLRKSSAKVLNWKVMRLNLYQLKTGTLMPDDGLKWPRIFLIGISGLMFGGILLPLMTIGTVQVVWQIITHNLPDRQFNIFSTAEVICLFIIMWFGALISPWLVKEAVLMAWWSNRRLYTLLQSLTQEGQLIRGYIESSQQEKKLLIPEITYRFNNPMGESIEGTFYPEPYQYSALTYAPGTPVWVLYLNDKTSVLL